MEHEHLEETETELLSRHDHAYLHEHGIAHLHYPDDTHEPGQTHGHTHESEREHGHGHTHANTRAVINRISRAIGHLEHVRRMIEEGKDCSEVLVQIAAVRAAINNVGKVILQDHIQHCLVEAVEHDDEKSLDDLCQAIDKFIK